MAQRDQLSNSSVLTTVGYDFSGSLEKMPGWAGRTHARALSGLTAVSGVHRALGTLWLKVQTAFMVLRCTFG